MYRAGELPERHKEPECLKEAEMFMKRCPKRPSVSSGCVSECGIAPVSESRYGLSFFSFDIKSTQL